MDSITSNFTLMVSTRRKWLKMLIVKIRESIQCKSTKLHCTTQTHIFMFIIDISIFTIQKSRILFLSFELLKLIFLTLEDTREILRIFISILRIFEHKIIFFWFINHSPLLFTWAQMIKNAAHQDFFLKISWWYKCQK